MYILELQYKNLDTYLQGTRHTPELWGSQVFRNIYTYLGGKYGISQYLYQLDLPFLKHNGLNTGNVYTTFISFIMILVMMVLYRLWQ